MSLEEAIVRCNGRRCGRGKGDPRHLRDNELPYRFKDVSTLLQDFMSDVEKSK